MRGESMRILTEHLSIIFRKNFSNDIKDIGVNLCIKDYNDYIKLYIFETSLYKWNLKIIYEGKNNGRKDNKKKNNER